MSLSEISIGAFILSAKSTANFIDTFGTDPGLTYHDTITINGSSALIGGSGEIVNINPFDNSGNDPIVQNIYVKNTANQANSIAIPYVLDSNTGKIQATYNSKKYFVSQSGSGTDQDKHNYILYDIDEYIWKVLYVANIYTQNNKSDLQKIISSTTGGNLSGLPAAYSTFTSIDDSNISTNNGTISYQIDQNNLVKVTVDSVPYYVSISGDSVNGWELSFTAVSNAGSVLPGNFATGTTNTSVNLYKTVEFSRSLSTPVVHLNTANDLQEITGDLQGESTTIIGYELNYSSIYVILSDVTKPLVGEYNDPDSLKWQGNITGLNTLVTNFNTHYDYNLLKNANRLEKDANKITVPNRKYGDFRPVSIKFAELLEATANVQVCKSDGTTKLDFNRMDDQSNALKITSGSSDGLNLTTGTETDSTLYKDVHVLHPPVNNTTTRRGLKDLLEQIDQKLVTSFDISYSNLSQLVNFCITQANNDFSNKVSELILEIIIKSRVQQIYNRYYVNNTNVEHNIYEERSQYTGENSSIYNTHLSTILYDAYIPTKDIAVKYDGTNFRSSLNSSTTTESAPSDWFGNSGSGYTYNLYIGDDDIDVNVAAIGTVKNDFLGSVTDIAGILTGTLTYTDDQNADKTYQYTIDNQYVRVVVPDNTSSPPTSTTYYLQYDLDYNVNLVIFRLSSNLYGNGLNIDHYEPWAGNEKVSVFGNINVLKTYSETNGFMSYNRTIEYEEIDAYPDSSSYTPLFKFTTNGRELAVPGPNQELSNHLLQNRQFGSRISQKNTDGNWEKTDYIYKVNYKPVLIFRPASQLFNIPFSDIKDIWSYSAERIIVGNTNHDLTEIWDMSLNHRAQELVIQHDRYLNKVYGDLRKDDIPDTQQVPKDSDDNEVTEIGDAYITPGGVISLTNVYTNDDGFGTPDERTRYDVEFNQTANKVINIPDGTNEFFIKNYQTLIDERVAELGVVKTAYDDYVKSPYDPTQDGKIYVDGYPVPKRGHLLIDQIYMNFVRRDQILDRHLNFSASDAEYGDSLLRTKEKLRDSINAIIPDSKLDNTNENFQLPENTITNITRTDWTTAVGATPQTYKDKKLYGFDGKEIGTITETTGNSITAPAGNTFSIVDDPATNGSTDIAIQLPDDHSKSLVFGTTSLTQGYVYLSATSDGDLRMSLNWVDRANQHLDHVNSLFTEIETAADIWGNNQPNGYTENPSDSLVGSFSTSVSDDALSHEGVWHGVKNSSDKVLGGAGASGVTMLDRTTYLNAKSTTLNNSLDLITGIINTHFS